MEPNVSLSSFWNENKLGPKSRLTNSKPNKEGSIRCKRNVIWQHLYRRKNVAHCLIKYFLLLTNAAGYHPGLVMQPTTNGALLGFSFIYSLKGDTTLYFA